MKVVKELIPYIIVIIFVLLLRYFIITPIQVVGTSMIPNLEDGELMILNKINYSFNDIERFDIVVVDYPDEPLIKRIVGLPGETVEYRNNKLYIDGELVKEKFDTNGKTGNYEINESGYSVIPENMYFVMGDNRINSTDSRSIGPVKKEQILGKANFVLYPFNKFGFIK